jgi:SAM-dependent methyltransferase
MSIPVLAKRQLRNLTFGVLLLTHACGLGPATRPEQPLLAPYVVSPQAMVSEMLRLAEVGPDDVVYDLGSGDGRIVIEAGRRGARGVGVELDPVLVERARENAARAHVAHLVEFRAADALAVDLAPATVVTVYLGRDANLQLRPRLWAQLRPGARVVSYEFDMGDWSPSAVVRVWDESSGFHLLYLWRVGARGAGDPVQK